MGAGIGCGFRGSVIYMTDRYYSRTLILQQSLRATPENVKSNNK